MPNKYHVKTNVGNFEVTLNQPPTSREELMQAIEAKVGQAGGDLPIVAPTEQSVRAQAVTNIQEAQTAREQAIQLSTTPEFKQVKQQGAKEGLSSFGKFALRAAPSLALGGAGAMGAARLGLGKLATAGVEALTGGAGEAAGQAVLGEQFDPTSMAIGAVFPGAIRGVQAGARGVGKFITRRLPGAEILVREQARKRVEALPAQLRPQVPSEDLYNLVRQSPDISIKMPETINMAKTLKLEEEVILPGLQSPTVKRVTRGVETKFPEGGISFDVAQANLRRLGARIRQAERGLTQEDAGALRQFRGAMMKDMDEAGEKFAALKAANNAFKKEAAADEFGEMITNAIQSKGEFDILNVDALRNNLRKVAAKDRLFRDGLGETNIAKINTFLKELDTEASKAGKVGAAVFFGGLGFGAGQALGLGQAAGIAGGAGAFFGPEVVESIILSDFGRKQFLRMMREGAGRVSRPAVAILANTIRAGSMADSE